MSPVAAHTDALAGHRRIPGTENDGEDLKDSWPGADSQAAPVKLAAMQHHGPASAGRKGQYGRDQQAENSLRVWHFKSNPEPAERPEHIEVDQ